MKKFIVTGRSNQKLAEKIAKASELKLGSVEISNFFDGELNIAVNGEIKGKEAYIVQSTSNPVNEHLMELVLMSDAVRRAEAKKITAIIPYFGYSRKEKMSRPGEPISAKVVAAILEMIGINKIITADLHSPAIQGFFKIPVVNLDTVELIAKEVKKLKIKDLVVVSPDIGGTKRARDFARALNTPVAIIEKHRYIDQNDKVQILNIIGQVKDKNVIIVDDLISTGSTIASAIEMLKAEGAKKIYIAATHLTVPAKAKENLMNLPVEKIFVTDSVAIKKEEIFDKLKIISLDKLISKEIN